MGAVQDFFDDLKSFITVDYDVTGFQGELLNVGDKFDLLIKISNTAGADKPYIRFYIYDCKVSRTDNAAPIDADGIKLDYVLPVQFHHKALDPVSQQYIDASVRMEALSANPESSQHGGQPMIETLAKIEISARWEADQCHPLVVEKRIRKNIVPG